MKIDNKNFIAFTQDLHLYNYKINYIDEVNAQSGFIPLLTANIIIETNNGKTYERLQGASYKQLFKNIIDFIENDKQHKIDYIFFRIGKAQICLMRY